MEAPAVFFFFVDSLVLYAVGCSVLPVHTSCLLCLDLCPDTADCSPLRVFFSVFLFPLEERSLVEASLVDSGGKCGARQNSVLWDIRKERLPRACFFLFFWSWLLLVEQLISLQIFPPSTCVDRACCPCEGIHTNHRHTRTRTQRTREQKRSRLCGCWGCSSCAGLLFCIAIEAAFFFFNCIISSGFNVNACCLHTKTTKQKEKHSGSTTKQAKGAPDRVRVGCQCPCGVPRITS
jgi:hypothetical protein